MSKPTTKLMEDLLKIVDEQAAQRQAQQQARRAREKATRTLPFRSRATSPFPEPAATGELPASNALPRTDGDS